MNTSGTDAGVALAPDVAGVPGAGRGRSAWAVPLHATPADHTNALLRPRVLWTAYAAFWAGLFLLWLVAYNYTRAFDGIVLPSVLFDVLGWMTIGTLSMAVGYVLPAERGPSVRLFVAVVTGAAALVMLRVLLMTALAPVFGWTTSGALNSFISIIPRHVLITTAYVGLGLGLRAAVRSSRELSREAALNALLADTRLLALRAHLRPRLLLDTMQSVADGIATDPWAADARLMALSDFLRTQLGRIERSRVPIDEELEFLRRYADFQAEGAGTRLDVSVDDAARDAYVPPNCVTLLFDAVARALPDRDADPRVAVSVGAADGRVRIELRAEGAEAGQPASAAARTGPSEELDELAETLRGAFGERFTLEFLAPAPDGAVTGTIRVPLETRWRPTA